MGFNFFGIAINKNYQEEIGELLTLFNEKLTFYSESEFSDAIVWKDKDMWDIYFGNDFTVIFWDYPRGPKASFSWKWALHDNKMVIDKKVCLFTLCEFRMDFSLDYFENSILTRRLDVENSKILSNSGQKFQEENNDPMNSVLIGFEKVTNVSFWSIPSDAKCFRYKAK